MPGPRIGLLENDFNKNKVLAFDTCFYDIIMLYILKNIVFILKLKFSFSYILRSICVLV